MREPSPEAWNRVQRYASWMRRVSVGDLAEGAFHVLRLNSPALGWFPALQGLSWRITESNLPYADLFFSPYLEKVVISPSPSWTSSGVPRDIVPVIASTVSALPASTLQSLWVAYTEPWADLKESLSSVALRCGPSLTQFISPIPLSDAAMNHLMQLPHLRVWRLEGPPPPCDSALPSPPTFPPLTEFALAGGATRGWISLFERLEGSVSSTQGVTPLSRMKESLRHLRSRNLGGSPDLVINVSFTSTVQIFRNLVSLCVDNYCHDGGRCTFKLNNDNVTKFAMALPQLECLFLGNPCPGNTCATTVACLLLISVYCDKLRELEIHFNTAKIVEDFKDISEDPRFQKLRSRPRCPLSYLGIHKIPLTVDSPNFEVVVNGMVNIFPSLHHCTAAEDNLDWDEVSERITERREM